MRHMAVVVCVLAVDVEGVLDTGVVMKIGVVVRKDAVAEGV